MMRSIQSDTIRHIFRARFGVQIVQEKRTSDTYGEEIQHKNEVETDLTRALKHSTSNAPKEEDDVDNSKPFKRESDKIGRNDPCPCGSGKKYKNCCGKED